MLCTLTYPLGIGSYGQVDFSVVAHGHTDPHLL